MGKMIDEQPDGCVSLFTLWAFCWIVAIGVPGVIFLIAMLIREALR